MTASIPGLLLQHCKTRQAGDSTHIAAVRNILATLDQHKSIDAFQRFTSSNNPGHPQPPLTGNDHGFWRALSDWAERHKGLAWILGLFLLFIAVAVWQLTLVIGLLVVVISLVVKLRRGRREHRAGAAMAAARTINPWPYGAEYRETFGNLAGERSDLRPEPELLGVAVALSEHIRATYVVRAGMLDTDQLLPQIDETLASISHQCHHIWHTRTHIEYPETNSEVGRQLRAAIDQLTVRTATNWDELLSTTSQLTDLAANCDYYSQVMRDHERHFRLLATTQPNTAAMSTNAALADMNASLAAQVQFINDTARRVANANLS